MYACVQTQKNEENVFFFGFVYEFDHFKWLVSNLFIYAYANHANLLVEILVFMYMNEPNF